jgi:hypothetical protein
MNQANESLFVEQLSVASREQIVAVRPGGDIFTAALFDLSRLELLR